MWKKTAAALAVLTCCFAFTALAPGAGKVDTPPAGIIQGAKEFEGTLDYNDGSGPHIPEWDPWIGFGITVDGRWYGLVLPESKDVQEMARKLIGKKVSVRGIVEKRTLNGLIPQQLEVIVVWPDLRPVVPGRQTFCRPRPS